MRFFANCIILIESFIDVNQLNYSPPKTARNMKRFSILNLLILLLSIFSINLNADNKSSGQFAISSEISTLTDVFWEFDFYIDPLSPFSNFDFVLRAYHIGPGAFDIELMIDGVIQPDTFTNVEPEELAEFGINESGEFYVYSLRLTDESGQSFDFVIPYFIPSGCGDVAGFCCVTSENRSDCQLISCEEDSLLIEFSFSNFFGKTFFEENPMNGLLDYQNVQVYLDGEYYGFSDNILK